MREQAQGALAKHMDLDARNRQEIESSAFLELTGPEWQRLLAEASPVNPVGYDGAGSANGVFVEP